MMLWPSEHYVDNLEKAILTGEIPMERLNDAVTRIMRVKQKAGLFDKERKTFYELTEEDKCFIEKVQRECSEKSITLIRDNLKHFPLKADKTHKIGIVTVAEYEPAKTEAIILKEEFEKRGFTVDYFDGDIFEERERYDFYEKNDVVMYALFSRPFRPIGFLDYKGNHAWQLARVFRPDNALGKTIFVSFGSPYFGTQYFDRAQTYVNAYSMLACSVKGFVKAACGEIDFLGISPVTL